MTSKLKYAVICASNQNRSMESHDLLNKNGFDICSFGTGTLVRLPGPNPEKPNVYDFNTSYDAMYTDLDQKDHSLYSQNGVLQMLDRNRRIKPAPLRFQDNKQQFDIIFTCEEKCFDSVCEEIQAHGSTSNRSVHVINFEIKDNHEDAALGAQEILSLAQKLEACDDLEGEIEQVLEEFQSKSPIQILHAIIFY